MTFNPLKVFERGFMISLKRKVQTNVSARFGLLGLIGCQV